MHAIIAAVYHVTGDPCQYKGSKIKGVTIVKKDTIVLYRL